MLYSDALLHGRILEIPLTTTQDYTLFYILNDYSIDLWKRQIKLILESHGLASFIVHPGYIAKSRALATYSELPDYLSRLLRRTRAVVGSTSGSESLVANRNQMKLVRAGANNWYVEGPGSERARVAYATIENGRRAYAIADTKAGVDQGCGVPTDPWQPCCLSDLAMSMGYTTCPSLFSGSCQFGGVCLAGN